MQNDIVRFCDFYVTTMSLWACRTSIHLMIGTRETVGLDLGNAKHINTGISSPLQYSNLYDDVNQPLPSPSVPRDSSCSIAFCVCVCVCGDFKKKKNRSLVVTEANSVHSIAISIDYYFFFWQFMKTLVCPSACRKVLVLFVKPIF